MLTALPELWKEPGHWRGEKALQKSSHLLQNLFCASVAQRMFFECCGEPLWALQSCDKRGFVLLMEIPLVGCGASREKRSTTATTRHFKLSL